jgi:hypothetical protein
MLATSGIGVELVALFLVEFGSDLLLDLFFGQDFLISYPGLVLLSGAFFPVFLGLDTALMFIHERIAKVCSKLRSFFFSKGGFVLFHG